MRQMLMLLSVLMVSSPAIADEGFVIAVPSGCDYFAVDSIKGIAVLEWYGGHQPVMREKVVGDFDQYGFHDIYALPGGNETHVWVEDYMLSRDHAASTLAEKCR